MYLNVVPHNKPALVKAFGTNTASALFSAWLSKALLFGWRCPSERERMFLKVILAMALNIQDVLSAHFTIVGKAGSMQYFACILLFTSLLICLFVYTLI